MKRLEAFPMDVYMAYKKTDWGSGGHTFQHEIECYSNFLSVFSHKKIRQTSGPFLESELARGDWQDKCPPRITWMGHGILGAQDIPRWMD